MTTSKLAGKEDPPTITKLRSLHQPINYSTLARSQFTTGEGIKIRSVFKRTRCQRLKPSSTAHLRNIIEDRTLIILIPLIELAFLMGSPPSH